MGFLARNVYKEYRADWSKYGKRAGPIRNKQMAKDADILIAFLLLGKANRGTNNMIDCMLAKKKPVYLFYSLGG